MNDDKLLGILGGLGPLATMHLCELIINRTRAEKDQDHINMIIFNHATIPDRTNYILKKSKENPLFPMKDDAIKLERLGASLIAIPCNTAHYFYDDIKKEVNIPIVHMIEETIKYVKLKNVDKVGILATTGTIETELYQKACEKYNINWEVPCKDHQLDVMHIIYDCVKAGKKVDMDIFNKIIKELKTKECSRIILGCTELSILRSCENLDDFYIDPMEIVADICVEFCTRNSL